MAKKIKFSFLKMLFRLFSFLADKTNGWKVFVKPKLLIGALILGVGVASCAGGQKNNATSDTQIDIDSIVNDGIECYKTAIVIDTPQAVEEDKMLGNVTQCYAPIVIEEDVVSCYEISQLPEDTIIKDIEENPDTIYTFVEQMPEFIGGQKEFLKWLNENIEYPQTQACVQGKVYVSFVVRKTGDIDSVSIRKGIHPLFDEEAMRVVKSMPKWQAGKQNGKNVNVWYTLPINFTIK